MWQWHRAPKLTLHQTSWTWLDYKPKQYHTMFHESAWNWLDYNPRQHIQQKDHPGITNHHGWQVHSILPTKWKIVYLPVCFHDRVSQVAHWWWLYSYNTTVLQSVNVTAQRMFRGAKYTHHTFTPIIRQQTELQQRKDVRWELNGVQTAWILVLTGFMTLFKVKITIKHLL